MPAASKMRSMRSISCTWYCIAQAILEDQRQMFADMHGALLLVRDHAGAEFAALLRIGFECEQVDAGEFVLG